MALERIDPFAKEDRYCVDHLLRYAWAKQDVEEKRVLDIACGHGFGTAIISASGAGSVVGIDADQDIIDQCRKRWKNPRVAFEVSPIESVSSLGLQPFDRIICFETLEHVKDPQAALHSLREILVPGGLLIGSVPGEPDILEENEFHLQFFNDTRLDSMLKGVFKHVRLYRQCFQLSSQIRPADDASSDVMEIREVELMNLDFGRTPNWADSYLFLASDGELPDMQGVANAGSRKAFLNAISDAALANAELTRLATRFRELFFKHGDLQRRFTNTLEWGKYYHQEATGEAPEQHYLEKIESAASRREAELRDELAELKEEVEMLRRQAKLQAIESEKENQRRRDGFFKKLKPDTSD